MSFALVTRQASRHSHSDLIRTEDDLAPSERANGSCRPVCESALSST